MTLEADEFIRRFLLHVLPSHFQSIQYYGFLADAHRREKLALCRKLLTADLTGLLPVLSVTAAVASLISGRDLPHCPVCRIGVMTRIETLPRQAGIDSS